MTVLWMVKVMESHGDSRIPTSGRDLPPPCGCPSNTEGMALCHVMPGEDYHTSPAPATLPIFNAVGTLALSAAEPGPVSSGGRSPRSVSELLAVQPSWLPAPSLQPVGTTGRFLATLLRSLLLGLFVAPPSTTTNYLTVGLLFGLFSNRPAVVASHFALRNGYGTVEARYHLTAYDCSDPTEVQAYSSIPDSPLPV